MHLMRGCSASALNTASHAALGTWPLQPIIQGKNPTQRPPSRSTGESPAAQAAKRVQIDRGSLLVLAGFTTSCPLPTANPLEAMLEIEGTTFRESDLPIAQVFLNLKHVARPRKET
mmetsp:Transcript_78187/g.173305  ORF Transcript_78187/g.173305 Transcript_78187/m.173305 type:complete len:116 (-) Transcript_78187:7-354(-)